MVITLSVSISQGTALKAFGDWNQASTDLQVSLSPESSLVAWGHYTQQSHTSISAKNSLPPTTPFYSSSRLITNPISSLKPISPLTWSSSSKFCELPSAWLMFLLPGLRTIQMWLVFCLYFHVTTALAESSHVLFTSQGRKLWEFFASPMSHM